MIKNPFEGNLTVSPDGKGGSAHIVTADQNEDIDAGLSPHTPEGQKGEFGRMILKRNGFHNAGIHDVVVRNNEKHADDTQQFNIALTFMRVIHGNSLSESVFIDYSRLKMTRRGVACDRYVCHFFYDG